MRFGYRINGKDMFRFLIYHVYHTRACIMAIAILILGTVGGVLNFAHGNQAQGWFYLIAGWGFFAIFHLNLWVKAQQQAKLSESFAQLLSMEFCEDEMIVTQGEQSANIPWEQIVKVKCTKHLILVYTDAVHAYLIPKENILPLEGENEADMPQTVTWEQIYDYLLSHVKGA